MTKFTKAGTVKGLGWAHDGSQVVDRLTGSSGRVHVTEEDLAERRRLVTVRWVDGTVGQVHVGRLRRPTKPERHAWRLRDRMVCP